MLTSRLEPRRSYRVNFPIIRDSNRHMSREAQLVGALSDVKVLDLTWVLSGPYASMVLCDLGAEVVKVERPPYGDVARTTGPHLRGESSYFFSINRGKKSTVIDLKNAAGKDL